MYFLGFNGNFQTVQTGKRKRTRGLSFAENIAEHTGPDIGVYIFYMVTVCWLSTVEVERWCPDWQKRRNRFALILIKLFITTTLLLSRYEATSKFYILSCEEKDQNENVIPD